MVENPINRFVNVKKKKTVTPKFIRVEILRLHDR